MDEIFIATISPAPSFITQYDQVDMIVFAFISLVMILLVVIFMPAFLLIFEFFFIVEFFCSCLCPGVT